MYSYLSKGVTVGQLLTRRLLRTVIGVPGMAIDLLLALFWLPDYQSYWDEMSLQYSDNTQTGFFQGLFGWVGEVAGYLLGALIGGTIGLGIGAIDGFLSLCRQSQDKFYASLHALSNFVGRSTFFDNYFVIQRPEYYLSRSWNIGALVIGVPLAAIPYATAKMLEFFIPALENHMSKFTTACCGVVGSIVLSAIAIPLYAVPPVADKLWELYDLGRMKVRGLIAIVYGKANVLVTPDNSCLGDEVMHSEEFCAEVVRAHKSTWGQLLFGPLKDETSPPVEPSAPMKPMALEQHETSRQIFYPTSLATNDASELANPPAFSPYY